VEATACGPAVKAADSAHHRLKAVGEGSGEGIKLGQPLQLDDRVETVVGDESADQVAVLLFDVGVVVEVMRPAPAEDDGTGVAVLRSSSR